jgi:hypothetical protein
MKLFNRYSGESLANLSYVIGALTVLKIAEIDKEDEVSDQLDAIKMAIQEARCDEFLVILVRQ